MKPKFNVGDVVKVIWRPKEVRNFPAWFFNELENKQIISSIDTNEGFPPEFYYSYYFEEPGYSKLSRLSFYENEIELAFNQPAFIKKTELPEI